MTALHVSLGLNPPPLAAAWFSAPGLYASDTADGIARGPALIADFRRNRHALTTVAAGGIGAATADALGGMRIAAFADLFIFTRASAAEYLDASGTAQQAAVDTPRFDYRNGVRQLLLEGPATNLFLNAHAPATQTVTVSSGTQYTISCRGSGSLALSGAGSGTVTQATPVTLTASSTTLTLTVTGSLSRAQVETGSVASSFIQTSGAAASRSADSCRFSPSAEALLQRTAATVAVQGQGNQGTFGRFIGIGTGEELLRLNSGQTALLMGNTLAIASVSVPLPAFGLCAGWNGSGRAAAYNGGPAASDAVSAATAGQIFLGRNQTGAYAQGRFDAVQIWPFRAVNSSIQAKANAFS